MTYSVNEAKSLPSRYLSRDTITRFYAQTFTCGKPRSFLCQILYYYIQGEKGIGYFTESQSEKIIHSLKKRERPSTLVIRGACTGFYRYY
ncbi:hypothetical protein [Dulcicalothrix desertica]|uniref:hypothetical protein n=1 Tax=Dulcicalothrix desertica TaxID=32056 RepID=UPI000F8DC9AF|nr:hypothetical protein [Dulcicalothrix desertica]